MALTSLIWDRSTVWVTLGMLAVYSIARFFNALYIARSRMLSLRAQGFPMPPYNPILGHLIFAYKITSKLPTDANPQILADIIRRELPDLGHVYYLDMWPFGPQMLVVTSVDGSRQMAQEHPLAKYHLLKDFLKPIADGQDIVTMEGEKWKFWRSVFNPGFSNANLMTLTSDIVDEVSVFCDLLHKLSQTGEVFRMRDLTDYLTLDVIGNIVLDMRLHSQTEENSLAAGLRSQTTWLIFGNEQGFLASWNPLRPFMIWYNKRRMNNYIAPRLEQQLSNVDSKRKTIIDLAFRAYNSSSTITTSSSKGQHTSKEDESFKDFALSQIKLFLFSGHDTTSSSVCYLFYVLAMHQDILKKMREEHDSILGADRGSASATLKSDPSLLNQLPYTTAIIKETMRLYPAVTSIRAGEPGFNIREKDSKSGSTRLFPTEDFLVWSNQQAIHRDPSLWPSADNFTPERWLTASSDDPLHPVAGAFRPFEHGPRNCIGQELAMNEMKIILALAGRNFDVKLAYDEVDNKKSTKIRTVYGERGYQIGRAQPSEDLPVRVSISSWR